MQARTSPPSARAASVGKSPPPAQSKPVPSGSAKFAVGDLVMCLDASKQEESGKHAGVVVSMASEKKLFRTKVVYNVRFLHRTLLRIAEKQLQRAKIKESAFPLVDLPPPALALVLFWVPLADAGVKAVVSRKFAAAFRDNVTWKRRCVEALKNVDVDEVFAAEKETSWITFFFRHASYRIRIVTVFYFSNGVSLSGEFTTRCDPRTTVQAFLEMVASHPHNRQRGQPLLKPHDPSKLGRRGEDGIVSENPGAKPNCEFRQGDPKATIAEAGLLDGAVLEQQERMFCD